MIRVVVEEGPLWAQSPDVRKKPLRATPQMVRPQEKTALAAWGSGLVLGAYSERVR
jgi:hypothetical protein